MISESRTIIRVASHYGHEQNYEKLWLHVLEVVLQNHQSFSPRSSASLNLCTQSSTPCAMLANSFEFTFLFKYSIISGLKVTVRDIFFALSIQESFLWKVINNSVSHYCLTRIMRVGEPQNDSNQPISVRAEDGQTEDIGRTVGTHPDHVRRKADRTRYSDLLIDRIIGRHVGMVAVPEDDHDGHHQGSGMRAGMQTLKVSAMIPTHKITLHPGISALGHCPGEDAAIPGNPIIHKIGYRAETLSKTISEKRRTPICDVNSVRQTLEVC